MNNLDLVIQYARDDKAISPSLAKEAIRYQADEIEALRGELEAKDKALEQAVGLLQRINSGRCLICEKTHGHYPICSLNTFLEKFRKEEIDG